MRLLILGGTVFLGRAVTDAALARGHEVVHLNRGRSSAPDPRVATILGDRAAIGGEELRAQLTRSPWDAVIDTSGYLPQVVGKSVEALKLPMRGTGPRWRCAGRARCRWSRGG